MLVLLKARDFELLRLSRSNHEAFAAFSRRYERLVVGWLAHQTRSPELAADLTTEVFAAAYLASGQFREGPEPAGAWLLGIARNKLLRSWRPLPAAEGENLELRHQLGRQGRTPAA